MKQLVIKKTVLRDIVIGRLCTTGQVFIKSKLKEFPNNKITLTKKELTAVLNSFKKFHKECNNPLFQSFHATTHISVFFERLYIATVGNIKSNEDVTDMFMFNYNYTSSEVASKILKIFNP